MSSPFAEPPLPHATLKRARSDDSTPVAATPIVSSETKPVPPVDTPATVTSTPIATSTVSKELTIATAPETEPSTHKKKKRKRLSEVEAPTPRAVAPEVKSDGDADNADDGTDATKRRNPTRTVRLRCFQCTAGYLIFHPMTRCAVHAVKGLACHAPVLLAHAEVTKT